MMVRSYIALRLNSVWMTILLMIIVSCGGAGVDARSGASREAEADDDIETDTDDETLREPKQLRSIDKADNKKTESSPPAADSACRLDAQLPPNIPRDTNAKTLHTLGQEQILARQGQKATAILFHAHKKDPKSAEILGDLATALLQCGNHDQAIVYAEKAAAQAPDNVDIAANLAQAYQIVGRMGDAIGAYRRAIKKAPEDPAIRNNLAVLLVLRDLESAEQEARKAVNLAPENTVYIINLSFILYRKKRYMDAEMVVKRAIKIDPQNADAYNQLGLVLAAQKREPQAIDSFRKALELRPGHRAAQENLKAMDEGFDFTGPWDKK